MSPRPIRLIMGVKSHWGCVTENVLLRHVEASPCLAVFFPGDSYGCNAPLLHYSRKAVLLAGCDTLSLEYGFQVSRALADMGEVNYVIEEAIDAIRQALTPEHKRLLFVSKSLGTYVAGEVASEFDNYAISHLYLTPLPSSIPAVIRSRGVVVCGTEDTWFRGEDREQLRGVKGLELVEIPNAGHSLELDDDMTASFEILDLVCEKSAGLAKATD